MSKNKLENEYILDSITVIFSNNKSTIVIVKNKEEI